MEAMLRIQTDVLSTNVYYLSVKYSVRCKIEKWISNLSILLLLLSREYLPVIDCSLPIRSRDSFAVIVTPFTPK